MFLSFIFLNLKQIMKKMYSMLDYAKHSCTDITSFKNIAMNT